MNIIFSPILHFLIYLTNIVSFLKYIYFSVVYIVDIAVENVNEMIGSDTKMNVIIFVVNDRL